MSVFYQVCVGFWIFGQGLFAGLILFRILATNFFAIHFFDPFGWIQIRNETVTFHPDFDIDEGEV